MTTKGSSVLVVDDNREWLETLMEALRGEGYVVRAAASGTQALSLLEDFTPDVVVTDLRMPLMDGEQLVAQLQARRPLLAIVVVTGDSGKVDSPQLGAVFDVIEKTASLGRLLSAVAAAAASGAA
jgi:CheY-like chemotaxis protein